MVSLSRRVILMVVGFVCRFSYERRKTQRLGELSVLC